MANWYHNLWIFLSYLSGGRELCIYTAYHLIYSGKYHRVFLLSILIAFNFFISHCLIYFYQEARPYWLSNFNSTGSGGISHISPEVYFCSKDFANPCIYLVASTCFTGFLIYEFKCVGLVTGVIWSLIIGYMRLVIGANTLNQIFFGVTIGFWISCVVFFIFNFNN